MSLKLRALANIVIILFSAISCTTLPDDAFVVPEKGFSSWLPAQSWDNALLCGNGTMGAMVYGNPHDETIIINHAALYLPITPPVKPIDQASQLDEIRQLLLEGKATEAAKIPVNQSLKEGYGGQLWSDPYIPAFDIKLKMEAANIEKYSRSVNYETGEAKVEWKQKDQYFQRTLFVSRADTVIVMKISGTGKINCRVKLERRPVEWNQWQYINDNIRKTEISAEDNYLIYRCEFRKNWEGSLKGYDGLGKLIVKEGTSEVNGNEIIIKDADEVILFLKVEPIFDYEANYGGDIKKKVNQLENRGYKTVLSDHIAVHSEFYNRVKFNLYGPEADYGLDAEVMMLQAKERYSRAFVEKQFYAARYNILCATGIQPPNLQGIWSGFWTPPWSSDYTHDGNLPVAVSSYLCANLPELMMTYVNYHEKMMPYYKENAQKLYGCRGIHLPSHTSVHGYDVHYNQTWCLTFWTAGAGWAASFFYDYYLYTGDVNFLRDHAYPFLKEVALFYEDFLKSGKNGKLLFNPSYSPENTPANRESQATINATMDVMVAKQVLRNCISAGKILQEDQTQLDTWEAMLTKMPEYEVNDKGELREWLWPDLEENHSHRHVSHLYGLYDRIDPDISGNPVLFEGARKAIEERMKVRRNENGGVMVFGMAQMAFVAANLGEREMVSDIVRWLSAQYWSNSLATYHDPGGLFNMDLSGGFQAVIIKTLIYSEAGFISLFPALPLDWDKGSIEGLLLRNQLKLEMLKWENNTVTCTLNSQIDQPIKIKLPSAIKSIRVLEGEGTFERIDQEDTKVRLNVLANKKITIFVELNKNVNE